MNQAVFTFYGRLRRIEAYVRAHPEEPMPLRRAAAIVGLEETYFCKFFHRRTGLHFTEWLHLVRVQHSMSLMQRENLSVTRVAHESGFASLRTFERAFAQVVGMTPREFQRRVRPG